MICSDHRKNNYIININNNNNNNNNNNSLDVARAMNDNDDGVDPNMM
jgi:hypothetical protein